MSFGTASPFVRAARRRPKPTTVPSPLGSKYGTRTVTPRGKVTDRTPSGRVTNRSQAPQPITAQQLRDLSPTLDALHHLTKLDVIHSAAQSDAHLSHALDHLSVPDFVAPKTSADEKQLRQDVRKEQGVKQTATLAKSGRQIQTSGSVAKALGDAAGPSSRRKDGTTDISRAQQQQRRVLSRLMAKPNKSEADVRTIGELLKEYHPKAYRNIEASYTIQQQKKSGTLDVPAAQLQTKQQRRRYAKQSEQSTRAREINRQAELGRITHPNMPHGLVAFLGDLIPDTPAEIAAAAAGGYLVRGAGGALIRAGVRGAARSAAEGVASVGGKAAGKAAAAADRAILGIAARSPKADKALYGAVRAGEKSAPALRAGAKGVRIAGKPVSIPAGYAGRHPGQGALGVLGGPPAVASAKQRSTNPLTAAAEGYYHALGNPKTYGTTLRAIPSLVTAPIGIAANVGKSIVTGNPKPAEQQAKDIADFGIEMAKTFASGDPKRIETAIENQYGLTPLIMVGIPGSKLLKRAGVNDAVGATLRKIPGVAKAVRRGAELKAHREDRLMTAKAIAHADNISHAEIAGRTGKNAVPGLRTIVENLNKSDLKRTGRDELKNRQAKITAEHLVKTIAEQGLTDRAHVEDFWKRHGQSRHADAPENRITNFDVAQFLHEHPQAVKDPHIQAAVNEFKRMQKEQGYERSQSAKYMSMGVTHGVTLPHDRFLTERAALGDVDALDALKRQTGEQDGRKISAAARQMHEDLVTKPNPEKGGRARVALAPQEKQAVLDHLHDHSRAQFVEDVKKVQEQKKLAEPAWTSDFDVSRRMNQGIAVGNRRAFAGSPSINTMAETRGILQTIGKSDQSFESLLHHSIIYPRRSRAINEATSHLFEVQSRRVPVTDKKGKVVRGPDGNPGVNVMSEQQAAKAVADGLINPDHELLLDAQNFQSALLDPRISDEEKLAWRKTNGALDRESTTLTDELKQYRAKKAAGVEGLKGRTYVVLPRHIADEFLKQHFGVKDRTMLQKSQHVASRAILGYSPSWLVAQPIAETAQGLAAVGPINQLRGLFDYRNQTPEGKLGFDSALGTTSGTSDIRFHGSQLYAVDTPGKANRISRGLEQTGPGRFVKGVTTGRGASNFDRWKGLAIRRGVAVGHLTREYKKAFGDFSVGLGNLMGEAEKLTKKYGENVTRQQVMEHFATDTAARAKLESYVDDVMGNWQALTHTERKAAGLIIFYPFLRMSLSWVLHTYPKRHPFKASIMHFLAQENADKLAQLTGGGPSFFPQWASAPLYDNQGKASQLIPLQRVAPGSNTVVEAVGNPSASPLTNLARALNPFVGGAATAFSGQDPLSGRVMVEHGQTVPTGLQAGIAASEVANLWTPFRALDKIGFQGKLSKGLIGKTVTPTAALYQKVGESNERQAIRSFIFPLLPESTDKITLQANIGRLLSDKYGSDKAKASRASGVLARLYAKYRVNPSTSSGSSSGGLGSGGLGSGGLGSGGL